MDFYNIIFTRRSIRKYKKTLIPEEKIFRILNAARFAPSGSNRQPTRLILITENNIKEKIVEYCANQSFIKEAPLIIVAIGKDVQFNRGNYMGKWAMLMDVAIVVDHLTLAARYEGIGTCWIGAFDNEKIKKILNIPDNWDVVALTPVGYPDGKGFRKTTDRIQPEEFIKNVKWNKQRRGNVIDNI